MAVAGWVCELFCVVDEDVQADLLTPIHPHDNGTVAADPSLSEFAVRNLIKSSQNNFVLLVHHSRGPLPLFLALSTY